MVLGDGQTTAQLQHSCVARGLQPYDDRDEMLRQLKDHGYCSHPIYRRSKTLAPALPESHQAAKSTIESFTTPTAKSLTQFTTSDSDDSIMSEGAPTPSAISAGSKDGPVLEPCSLLKPRSSTHDSILRDFLDRERKLSLREGALLEREKQQGLLDLEMDKRRKDLGVQLANSSKREQVVGNIETTQESQAEEAKRLAQLSDDLASKEQTIEAKRHSLAEKEDRIIQRAGTEKQQNEKEQRLGQWEYRLTKDQEELWERQHDLAAKENQDALIKLRSILRGVPASQAEKASSVIQSDFYAPRLSTATTIIPTVSAKPSRDTLDSVGWARSHGSGHGSFAASTGEVKAGAFFPNQRSTRPLGMPRGTSSARARDESRGNRGDLMHSNQSC